MKKNVFGFLALTINLLFFQNAKTQTNSWISSSNVYRSTAASGTNLDLYLWSADYAAFNTNRPYFVAFKDFRSSTGLFGSNGSSNLRLHTNGIERMRIMNATGFAGMGILTPQHNLHVHGVTDYIESGSPSFMGTSVDDEASELITPKTTTNYGKASRISLTNSLTGTTATDGGLLLQTESDLHVWNREEGSLFLKTQGVALTLNGPNSRILTGSLDITAAKHAKMNVQSNTDNGLYVQANSSGKYGIAVRVISDSQTTFQSFSTDDTQPNFKVTGGGEVYARKYTTTLANFPDYVFSSTYELMPFSELRRYINTNKHLPNVPSAEEIEENGADLGELNRILVEKVEELTLYILEMEERLSELEEKK